MKLKTNKPYSGVVYESNGPYWAKKSQVPNITELPSERIYTRYTRFPQHYTSNYDYIDYQPLKIGDTYELMGAYSPAGIVSNIEVTENSSNAWQITITCDKSFERVEGELVLLNKEFKQNITMYNFFEFFDRLHIYKEINFAYTDETDMFTKLIPKYKEEIRELKAKVTDLETKLREKHNAIDNIDKFVHDKIIRRECDLANAKRLEENRKREEEKAKNRLSPEEIHEIKMAEIQNSIARNRERRYNAWRKENEDTLYGRA